MRLSSIQIEANKQETVHVFDAWVWLFDLRIGDNQRGFTLVELIMVMIIVGILAAVVAPRFFDSNVFQSRGFADQVQATLRYAQKEAIAQHRFICVVFPTNNSITLTINTTATCPGSPLVSLSGNPTSSITANPASITFAALPADFYFDALGKPSQGQTITISTYSITVEAETGYVHSP
jgi:MSHA pilin protein MshC